VPRIVPVPLPIPDPKAAATRRVSGIAFPYYNLAQSIDVARVIHEHGGGSCDRSQLAALLKYKGTRNGSFLNRVGAAKMFGLIEPSGDQLKLSARGQAIVAPVLESETEKAKIDAFLAVDLFRKVFDEYKGRHLPPETGLKNLLQSTYQVVPDRVTPTVKIMLDSADEAGFFRVAGNRSKMVMPITSSASAPQLRPNMVGTAVSPEPVNHGGGARTGAGPASGDGDVFGGIHPAIIGMLTELPPVGTTLTARKRSALIAAFSAFVGLIYPDPESEG
jgi:hypothetical protein